MKVQAAYLEKQKLNASSNVNTQEVFKFVANLRQRLWSFCISLLKTDELKIQVLQDKFDTVFWIVDDPIVMQKLYFSSETELRAWLDRRYSSNL
jgi:hypothetical protein